MERPIFVAKVSKAKFIAISLFVGVFGIGSLAMGAVGPYPKSGQLVLIPIVVLLLSIWTYIILALLRNIKYDCGFALFSNRIEVRRVSLPYLRVEYLSIPLTDVKEVDTLSSSHGGGWYYLVLMSGQRILLPDVKDRRKGRQRIEQAVKSASSPYPTD